MKSIRNQIYDRFVVMENQNTPWSINENKIQLKIY